MECGLSRQSAWVCILLQPLVNSVILSKISALLASVSSTVNENDNDIKLTGLL